MSPITRRVLQAVLYEIVAIAFVGPVLSFAFQKPQASTFGLAVVLSTIALTWNYVFNWIFERWESRHAVRGRSLARRPTAPGQRPARGRGRALSHSGAKARPAFSTRWPTHTWPASSRWT